jgi:transposase
LNQELLEHLEIWRGLIGEVQKAIEQIERRILARSQSHKEARPKWAGELSLERIESEVCSWERFSSWRKAGGYTGLTGGVSASGEYHRELSITKRGNRRLRTALIEMAWRMARNQPGYWLSKKWASVVGPGAKSHRRARKKAIVAYARGLFVDLWKWKTRRITAQELGWEMVQPSP